MIPARHFARRAGRPAFTLVELLTAVAIISLLVCLAAGAMGRAKDYARLSICKTRLHNLGASLATYAAENRGRLPVTGQIDNPQQELLAALAGRSAGAEENFYCPSQTKPALMYSPQNLAAGSIGYFYYSCRAATTNRAVSTFLRWEVAYPRELKDSMPPGTWVMSDCWYSGEPTSHEYYKKGVNYLTLNGAVSMLEASPRAAFE